MPEELTQAAKDAIAEAVRIVKEDKWDAFLRERVGKHAGTPPKPNDPPTPNPPTPTQPPPTDPPTPNDPPTPTDPPKKKSAYWGELFDE